MSVKSPPPPPISAELEGLLRRLRLPYVRHAAPEVLANATAQRWEPAEVLRVLLAEEAAGRDKATIRNRRRASGLPSGKTLEAWDENASAIPKATQQDSRRRPQTLPPQVLRQLLIASCGAVRRVA